MMRQKIQQEMQDETQEEAVGITGGEARQRARLALGYFLLVALMGLLLRWFFVSPVAGVNYKYVLHAHSHVALLGWLYGAFFALLLYAFPPRLAAQRKSFKRQFLLTQVAVVGMLLSFPVQGYAWASITFSTLHLLLSYWFAWSFWRQVNQHQPWRERHAVSIKFIGAGLIFLVLSSLGPWALGPVMALGLSGSVIYYSAIYFYLHFQYNGWFLFAGLGLFFWLLETHQMLINRQAAERAFWFLALACVPAYALSVLWAHPPVAVYGIGGAAALLQLAGAVWLLYGLWQQRSSILHLLASWPRWLLQLALFSFVLKIILQTASAWPYVADLAYRVRYFIIAYLHLSLLGFVSLLVLGLLMQQRLLRVGPYGRSGLILLLAGFAASELLLGWQGGSMWLDLPLVPDFNLLVFLGSLPMPAGLLLLFSSQFTARKAQQPALVAGTGKIKA
jgi:hypothetical protein